MVVKKLVVMVRGNIDNVAMKGDGTTMAASAERADMKTVNETVLNEVLRRIRRVTRPDRVVLFGSAAAGAMSSDSDVDILVLESDPGNHLQESARIRRELKGLGFPFDVFVMKTDRFEATKDFIGGLAYPAHHYGRTIYAA